MTTPSPNSRRSWVIHPWVVAAYPVLFLYAHNILYVDGGTALRALPITLSAVTVVFVGLRLATGSTVRAGILTTFYSLLFFSYGAVLDFAVARGLLGQPGLLAIWALVAAAGTIPIWRGFGGRVLNDGLNLVAGVLVLMPTLSIAGSLWVDMTEPPASGDALAAPRRPQAASELRDIYYIVLDEYQRRDNLLDAYGFDNRPFESELEERGFYVASEANSNYSRTVLSLASTLNMRYLDDVVSLPSVERIVKRLRGMVQRHEVGRILRDLGYTNIHVSSGKHPTATSRIADVVYDFAPSGVRKLEDGSLEREAVQHDFREFTMLLLGTTLAGRLVGRSTQEQLVLDSDVPYTWYAPERTLLAFETVGRVAARSDPTFTFLHVIKPHAPYVFDRHGNVLEKPPGWIWKDGRDDHQAMLEQLIFLNRLVIDLIDRLLASSERTPIIVIQGDHGEKVFESDPVRRTEVLSAFLLPDGGREKLYPSVSNVNTFRLILSHYFGLPLEPLDYRGFVAEGVEVVEITRSTSPPETP